MEVESEQNFLLKNLKTGKVRECSVVRTERAGNSEHLVAFQFANPSPDFWPSYFPQRLATVMKRSSRILLGYGTMLILLSEPKEKPQVYVLYRRCVKCRISPQFIGQLVITIKA
jgi:hypothetical protein